MQSHSRERGEIFADFERDKSKDTGQFHAWREYRLFSIFLINSFEVRSFQLNPFTNL